MALFTTDFTNKFNMSPGQWLDLNPASPINSSLKLQLEHNIGYYAIYSLFDDTSVVDET